MLQNKSLPKYLKVNSNSKVNSIDEYGKDVDLSILLHNKKLFPIDKTTDLNIIFIDTCRVMWARLPGISYQNEYISFKKAVNHNKNPTEVEQLQGRFFTLKNNLRENQVENHNKNKYILTILNNVSKYRSFEINRTKKFLKQFTINTQTQKLLKKYSRYKQNNKLKALIKHVRTFNTLNKDINNFFKLRKANNQNVKDVKSFYVDKNINTTLKAIVNDVACEL